MVDDYAICIRLGTTEGFSNESNQRVFLTSRDTRPPDPQVGVVKLDVAGHRVF